MTLAAIAIAADLATCWSFFKSNAISVGWPTADPWRTIAWVGVASSTLFAILLFSDWLRMKFDKANLRALLEADKVRVSCAERDRALRAQLLPLETKVALLGKMLTERDATFQDFQGEVTRYMNTHK